MEEKVRRHHSGSPFETGAVEGAGEELEEGVASDMAGGAVGGVVRSGRCLGWTRERSRRKLGLASDMKSHSSFKCTCGRSSKVRLP